MSITFSHSISHWGGGGGGGGGGGERATNCSFVYQDDTAQQEFVLVYISLGAHAQQGLQYILLMGR